MKRPLFIHPCLFGLPLVAFLTGCAALSFGKRSKPIQANELSLVLHIRSQPPRPRFAFVDLINTNNNYTMSSLGTALMCLNKQRVTRVGNGRIFAAIPLSKLTVTWSTNEI